MTSGSDIGRVLVTGGRGFIGSAIVERLVGGGLDVRSGVRRALPPETYPCDLDNLAQVRAAARGICCVVHTAYGDSTLMVQQCSALLDAMASEGVDHLVYLSSIAVYGSQTGAIDEMTPSCGVLDAYAAAKRDCENLVRAWAAAGNRRALILRPGIVYGKGSPFWITKLSERILCGAWGTFGTAGEGRAALVHVDDVAALIEVAVQRLLAKASMGLPDVAVLNVAGPEAPSWNAYFIALAKALGAPPLREIGPVSVAARQVLAFAAKIWRRMGLPGGDAAALAATPGEIALFSRKATYSTGAAMTLLGFQPGIGLAKGLARSLPQTKE